MIACNDDAVAGPCSGTLQSNLTFDAIAGSAYLIQIGGFDSSSFGPGTLAISCVASAEAFERGDCNRDGTCNIADAIFLLGFLFPNGLPSDVSGCQDACDSNDDGQINIADAITELSALFGATTVPLPAPTACGADPTMDGLDCPMSPCP